MNAALAKIETIPADGSGQIRPDHAASEPLDSLPLTEEASPDENTERRVYRRSAAYFFFGFGCNKNVILTDEP